jgi:hypothetical protein
MRFSGHRGETQLQLNLCWSFNILLSDASYLSLIQFFILFLNFALASILTKPFTSLLIALVGFIQTQIIPVGLTRTR